MNIPNKYIDRISQLTEKEASIHSGKYDLFLSLIEEIGELATAIKVERGIVKHKKIGEKAYSEAIDVFICAVMMYSIFKRFNHSQFSNSMREIKDIFPCSNDIFIEMARISKIAGKLSFYLETNKMDACFINATTIAFYSLEMFTLLGGKNRKEALAIIDSKLNKWEKNQNKLSQ